MATTPPTEPKKTRKKSEVNKFTVAIKVKQALEVLPPEDRAWVLLQLGKDLPEYREQG